MLSSNVTAAGLAKLAALPSLEELAFDGEAVTAAGLEQLVALQRLRALHIHARQLTAAGEVVPFVAEEEPEPYLQALRRLRQANPGIVIDGDYWRDLPTMPAEYDTAQRSLTLDVRRAVQYWEEAGRPVSLP